MNPTLALRCAGVFALSFSLATPTFSQEIAATVVDLPEYTVRTDRMLPLPEAWRYARIPGFEVLSSSSERETRRVVREFQEVRRAIDVVWPGMQRGLPRDCLLIVCGPGRFAPFVPTKNAHGPRTTLALRDKETAALVIDNGAPVVSLFGSIGAGRAADVDLFGLNIAATSPTAATVPFGMDVMALEDRYGLIKPGLDPTAPEQSDALGFNLGQGLSSPFEVVSTDVVVDQRGQRQREYVRFLFSQLENPLPAWLDEGLARLFMTMEVGDDHIRFARLRYDVDDTIFSSPQAQIDNQMVSVMNDYVITGEKEFNTALGRRALLPMDEFFAMQRDAAATQDVVTGRWAHQAAAFVHWGLYGNHGANRKDFLKFVDLSYRQPVTEAMVRDAFGMSFEKLSLALRGYIAKPTFQEVTFVARDGKLKPIAEIELRDATQAEVGRIKGVAFRLAGHDALAHTTLATAYARGERDPQLLAELGLQEQLTGKPDRSRRLLEAASKAKVSNSRAHVALARLRLAEARGKPAAPEGKFDARQTYAVLEPLFAARAQPTLRSEVYDLIAEAWSQSAVKPRPEHLAVLKEGLARFPHNVNLLYEAAALYAKHKYTAEAADLVRIGLHIKNPSLRSRFETLQASLPR